MIWVRCIAFMALHAAAVTAAAQAAPAQDKCEALFSQAVAELAAEQYGSMLAVAQERMRVCPEPKSALLIGLAEANLVDALVIEDPAEREMRRRSAVRHLRIAATQGTALPLEWMMTVAEWLPNLQGRGPVPAEVDEPGKREQKVPEASVLPEVSGLPAAPEVPKAPPPSAQPVFPWGPFVTGTLGLGAAVAGMLCVVAAHNHYSEARLATDVLKQRADTLPRTEVAGHVQEIRAIEATGDTYGAWGTALLVGGGAALSAATVWYLALPPKGKWRWAVTPHDVSMTVRF